MVFELSARRPKRTVRDGIGELGGAGCRWYGGDRLVGKRVENQEYAWRIFIKRNKPIFTLFTREYKELTYTLK